MRKTQKRIFGFFGLLIVAMMTIIATMIPSPGASANSVTDTIIVRVVGNVTNAKFQKPSGNVITTDDGTNYIFNYENASAVRLALSYTNKENATVDLEDYELYPDLGNVAGTKDENLNVRARGFSYGRYILSLYATGPEGSELLYDSISIEYIPVIAEAEQNEDNGLVDLDLSSYDDEDVEIVEIYLDGELIKTVPKDKFDEVATIDLGDKESGEYTFDVIAKNADGDILYSPYKVTFDYDATGIPDTDVPDTGYFFQNLNISREDYLITGLIVFFVFGIVAFSIVAKGSKRK